MILSDSLRPLRWKLRAVSMRQTKKSAPSGRTWVVTARYTLFGAYIPSVGSSAAEHCRLHIVNNL
jgi:hypothetical protein